ncbi:TonB-dependent siderophore receptor [Acetobacteraceae bacterium AT-5844]|nr:TonB-dependent siderophore receptor [Acetobacteraceae bacterium AT-5844]
MLCICISSLDQPSMHRLPAATRASGLASTALATTLFASGLLAAALPSVLPSPALAQASAATPAFDIAPQPLASALTSFGLQSGYQVSVDQQQVAGRRSPGATGSMAPEEALRRLLSGTGFTYRFTDERSLTLTPITPAPSASAAPPVIAPGTIALPEVSVIGRAESAYGPVHGYRATRSATGTRTDTPLRDIPQSIQVVPRDVIEDQQAVRLTDALSNVSNVRLNATNGNRGEVYQIRGFTTPRYAIDGVLLNSAADRPEAFLDLANVERVEVLKGPASVLYGQGDPGGLINIVTRRPPDQFSADAQAQIGSFEFHRLQGSLGGPLVSDGTLTGRITGALQESEGFRSGAAESRHGFAALALSWRPDDRTSIDLDADYINQSLPFERGLIVTPGNRVILPRERFLGEDWSLTRAHRARIGLGIQHEATDWLTLRFNGRYTDARISDSYAIDFRDLASDGRTLGRRATNRVEDLNDLNLRFDGIARFLTGPVEHTVLAGVEYARSAMDFTSYRGNIDPIDIYRPIRGVAPRPRLAFNSAYDATTDLYALYLQDQITLTPQWKLLGGLRYDTAEEKRIEAGVSQRNANDAFTFRGGIVYQPVESLSLYASYTESFRPQSGQLLDGGQLEPERGQQYEIGAKWDALPNRLSITAAIFQITKRNVATDDPRDSDYSVQTGEQRVRGVELDVAGEILPGWQVIANIGLLDAEITEDNTFRPGNRLTGVPEASGRLWTSYAFQDGPLNGLTLGGGITIVGAREGDLENSFSIDGYHTVDAAIGYAINENIELSVVGRNITDRSYIEAVSSRTEVYPGAPQTFLASLRARF